ncbi:MAG: hypothetical protein JNL62_14695 [Bryobacterales bacterium]|nr:hypothetical protein [Bryobacterales bacterium]
MISRKMLALFGLATASTLLWRVDILSQVPIRPGQTSVVLADVHGNPIPSIFWNLPGAKITGVTLRENRKTG